MLDDDDLQQPEEDEEDCVRNMHHDTVDSQGPYKILPPSSAVVQSA